MHDFLAGFNSPESVLADQNDLFSVFATDFEKREFCKFFPKTTLFHIYWYYIVNVSTMHDFLAGFNSPESVLADQNDLFSVFATDFEKREFCKFFPKTTLFHIYWYYIVNVSTMHDFLAGFNSPESVLADQNDLFSVFATDFEKREFCKFFPKTTLFHIYWYYIVNVSTMHDFLAGFNSPESVLADQNDLFSVFATDFEKREFCKFFPKTTLFHICWYYIVNVSTMHDFLPGLNSPESVLADQNDLFSVFATDFEKREFCKFSPKPHYFTIKPPLFQYICNVSTMFDFLACFSFPFLQRMNLFPLQNGNSVNFSSKPHYFTFIGTI